MALLIRPHAVALWAARRAGRELAGGAASEQSQPAAGAGGGDVVRRDQLLVEITGIRHGDG